MHDRIEEVHKRADALIAYRDDLKRLAALTEELKPIQKRIEDYEYKERKRTERVYKPKPSEYPSSKAFDITSNVALWNVMF